MSNADTEMYITHLALKEMEKKEMTDEVKETEHEELTYGEVVDGEIDAVNLEKGFGFITSLDRPFIRFFFHWKAVRQEGTPFLELRKKMKVRFQEAKGSRGWRAVKVEVLEDKK